MVAVHSVIGSSIESRQDDTFSCWIACLCGYTLSMVYSQSDLGIAY